MIKKNKRPNKLYNWFHRKTNMKFWRFRHLWDEVIFVSVIASQYVFFAKILDSHFSLTDAVFLLITALVLNKKMIK